jgi:hypothetical protein
LGEKALQTICGMREQNAVVGVCKHVQTLLHVTSTVGCALGGLWASRGQQNAFLSGKLPEHGIKDHNEEKGGEGVPLENSGGDAVFCTGAVFEGDAHCMTPIALQNAADHPFWDTKGTERFLDCPMFDGVERLAEIHKDCGKRLSADWKREGHVRNEVHTHLKHL